MDAKKPDYFSFSNGRFSECFILAVTNNKMCVICVDVVVVLWWLVFGISNQQIRQNMWWIFFLSVFLFWPQVHRGGAVQGVTPSFVYFLFGLLFKRHNCIVGNYLCRAPYNLYQSVIQFSFWDLGVWQEIWVGYKVRSKVGCDWGFFSFS